MVQVANILFSHIDHLNTGSCKSFKGLRTPKRVSKMQHRHLQAASFFAQEPVCLIFAAALNYKYTLRCAPALKLKIFIHFPIPDNTFFGVYDNNLSYDGSTLGIRSLCQGDLNLYDAYRMC